MSAADGFQWSYNETAGFVCADFPAAPDLLSLGSGLAAEGSVANILVGLFIAPYFIAVPLFLVMLVVRTLPEQIMLRLASRKKTGEALPSGVWTIHGKQYDLREYVKHHPGGAWAINLGRNRDCTGLFESYHVFADRARLERILARYEVRPSAAGEQLGSPAMQVSAGLDGLVFGDAFHGDIREMCRAHFKGKSPKMKPWTACACILSVCVEAVALYYFFRGSTWPLVVLPASAWVAMVNVGHDASHFAVSKHPWVNGLVSWVTMPLTMPPTCWSVEHVVQHHVYTNDEDDVDLYHFLPVCRTSRFTRWTKAFRLQYLAIFMVLPTSLGHLSVIVPIDLLTGQRDWVTGSARYEEVQNLRDFVAMSKRWIQLELFVSVSCWVLSVWMHGFHGFCRMAIVAAQLSWFFIFATQGAHLRAECMVGKEDQYASWAKRQVACAVNFGTDCSLTSFLMGGLNVQSLHHVIPEVGSSHYTDLYPEFKRICAKHGVPVTEVSGMGQFFAGFISWVRELAEMAEGEAEHAKAS